ncbi:MAG: DUF5606 domain-containing protein [Bacteroidetes bacterium]|nr:DUF5606 domain-containing protein [Bacteroidota bacterium]
MDLSKILSISGMSGLFKVVAQGKSGLIVESLADKKRIPVHATNKISVLDNISIYVHPVGDSKDDTIPLQDLLKKIYEKQNGGVAPDSKSSDDELKKFFGEVLPEYDKEKVHTSDIRKAILWYNLLQKTDIFTKKEEDPDGAGKKDDAPVIAEEGTKKPEHNFTHENQGKHLNPTANVPKKTMGVRKTGVA